jgi:competence ComEA-like helix-hairpin-helix protein
MIIMFGLTSQERRVIVFLITVALAGTGINFCLKRYLPAQALSIFSQNIGKINLNTADKDSLISVPGVGKKLAQCIIEYRINQEEFGSVEELKNIRGITAYRYEKIKDYFIAP